MPIGRGCRASAIPASCGVRLPFALLHGWQAATRFSHVDCPPRERGNTWSSVRLRCGRVCPQYWQLSRSRSRMFLRETERFCRGALRYLNRRITLGTGRLILAVRMTCGDGSSTTASPLRTIVIARRAGQILIGSKLAFSTRTGRLIEDMVAHSALLTLGYSIWRCSLVAQSL